MQLKQGSLLQGGKYRIVRMLGQGGFGITYLAENTMLEGKVAIKEFFFKEYCNRDEATSHVTIPTEGNRELVERFKQKFIKEARTIFKLNHPNIVAIHDIFEENGTAYYVMDYIEGESLGDRVKLRGAIPEAEALGYIKEVANALSYIHGKSINHLDIKPGNIMKRREDGKVLLIDFGVAKQYDAETSKGTTTTPVGISHGYSPTEQYQRHGVQTFSPQSDVYALAATLYKLLTGVTPPEAMIVQDEGLPVAELESKGIPASVIKSIESAMLSRSRRTQSIDAFVANLEGESEITIVNVDPEPKPKPKPQPKPVPQPEPKPKSSKSKMPWIIAALVAVAGIVLGVVLSGGKDGREGDLPILEQVVRYDTTKETPHLAATLTTGTHNGHEWVDLGLPSGTKWATMNVGANSPGDYGSYFAWGETKPKSSYTWENLKYRISGNRYDNVKFSKYVTDSKYGNVDRKVELELSDDAAYANWGSGWRMPSKAQQEELQDRCTRTRTTMGGHNGYELIGPNGNSIFLPAAGHWCGSSSYTIGSECHYYSRTLELSCGYGVYELFFTYGSRSNGASVRPVYVPD